jgi:ATP-dependent DNA helicase RecQ
MPNLHQTLSRFFGFSDFRPGQEDAIRSLLQGQHTLVVMPTGAGKSLIYQLAAMCLPEPSVTLVLSPLIALMKDQVDSLNQRSIPATFINSTLTASEQSRRLAAAANGTYRLIYVAPERLRSVSFQKTIRQMTIGLFVVDEAHCISHWGHDFRPDYRRIAPAREEMGRPLTAALTATATTLVQRDIAELLAIPDAYHIVTGFNRPNLFFAVHTTSDTESKQASLRDLLSETIQGTAIVYTGTRREAEAVAAFITHDIGTPARYYHAGLDSEQRTAIQNDFLSGNLPVVVATNAFGMGIDRPDVRLVVHYNLPGTLEAYYQEAGRAGRDGKPARAVLLYSPQDRLLQQWFIEQNNITAKDMQTIYHALNRSRQSQQVSATLEQLAVAARLDPVKIRLALAHLERAGIIQQEGDEGATIHITLARWNKAAIKATSDEMEEYRVHRQAQLDQMTSYAESNGCRRRMLLHYFSDHGNADAEVCCDNCTAQQTPPPPQHDVHSRSRSERAALIILDALRRIGWGIGRKRLAELLRGARTKEMTPHYQQNRYYGKFKQYRQAAIEGLIEHLIRGGYLKIVGGDRPVLAMTRQGKTALAARAPIPLQLPDEQPSLARSSSTHQSSRPRTADETLRLFQEGKTPTEIAEERGLVVSTIYGHLATLVGEGRVALADVVDDETVSQIQAVIDQNEETLLLSQLKEQLPDEISYGEIRCVVEDVRRQRRARRGQGG